MKRVHEMLCSFFKIQAREEGGGNEIRDMEEAFKRNIYKRGFTLPEHSPLNHEYRQPHHQPQRNVSQLPLSNLVQLLAQFNWRSFGLSPSPLISSSMCTLVRGLDIDYYLEQGFLEFIVYLGSPCETGCREQRRHQAKARSKTGTVPLKRITLGWLSVAAGIVTLDFINDECFSQRKLFCCRRYYEIFGINGSKRVATV